MTFVGDFVVLTILPGSERTDPLGALRVIAQPDKDRRQRFSTKDSRHETHTNVPL
jgi:hypothetical protein